MVVIIITGEAARREDEIARPGGGARIYGSWPAEGQGVLVDATGGSVDFISNFSLPLTGPPTAGVSFDRAGP
jgi:hypothetical protein